MKQCISLAFTIPHIRMFILSSYKQLLLITFLYTKHFHTRFGCKGLQRGHPRATNVLQHRHYVGPYLRFLRGASEDKLWDRNMQKKRLL